MEMVNTTICHIRIENSVLNFTYLHCLQHSFFEHLFNLYHSTLKNIKENMRFAVVLNVIVFKI